MAMKEATINTDPTAVTFLAPHDSTSSSGSASDVRYGDINSCNEGLYQISLGTRYLEELTSRA